jgi:hypothetical protein
MEYHEYSNIFPMIHETELHGLIEDIRANGLRDAITTYQGKILDGRNRHRACEAARVNPIYTEYQGSDPLGFVMSHNLHRRHLTESQRAMAGARMANLKKGGDAGIHKSNTPMGALVPAVTIQRAAELSGSSRKNIERARPIVQNGIEELQDMVETGEVSIRAASEVAKLPKEEQRKAVAGVAKGVKKAARQSRQQEPPKKKRKKSITTEEDVERENQKILAILKTNWAIAPKPIRETFLAWMESQKNTTAA